MQRPTNAPRDLSINQTDDLVAHAKEHVIAAAVILKSLGPDMSRVAWMLEDSLTFIDQALHAEDEVFDDTRDADLQEPAAVVGGR